MPTCLICLKKREKLKFSTPRMKICRWCVRTLNRESMTVSEAEEGRAAMLHSFLFHRSMQLINSGDPAKIPEAERQLRGLDEFVERVRSGGFTRQCLDPNDRSVEIKIIRAFKKGLVLPGRQYTALPNNWAFTALVVKHQDSERCNACGKTRADDPDLVLHAHHIVHRSYGGSNNRKNLVTLCYACHQEQHPDIVISIRGGEPDGVYLDPEDAAPPEEAPAPFQEASKSQLNRGFDRDLAMFASGRGPDPREQAGPARQDGAHRELATPPQQSSPVQPASQKADGRVNAPAKSDTQKGTAEGWKFWGACIVFFILFKACGYLISGADSSSMSGKGNPVNDSPMLPPDASTSISQERTAPQLLSQPAGALSESEIRVALEFWLERNPHADTEVARAALSKNFDLLHQENPDVSFGVLLDESWMKVQAEDGRLPQEQAANSEPGE